MDWAKNFAEMWERLWDLLIYPILELFDIELKREEDAE